MTRNIGQWINLSATCSSGGNADELHLLRGSSGSALPAKQQKQPRCVSWAPGLFDTPILSSVKERRRNVTHSWYGGQTTATVTPACHSSNSSGVNSGDSTTIRSHCSNNSSSNRSKFLIGSAAYGSTFTTSTTLADATGIHHGLPPNHQTQPLLSSSSSPTIHHKQQHGQKEAINTTTTTPASQKSNTNSSPPVSPLPTKKKTARTRGIDLIMPSLRSLVSRRTTSGSTTSLTGLSSEGLRAPTIVIEGAGGLRKCETAIALSRASSRTTLLTEPIPAVNRLRVGVRTSDTLCSRCSSLLSLATSGSRYSLNAASATFVPVPPVLCKLCLNEVPHADTCTLQQCACIFCKDCMQAYVSFEIVEGAYDISCPDAQCPTQGVVTLSEIERLVDPSLVDKHKKYRLNREVDIDKNRTWCPRAGCETVCSLCPTEICLPQSVHCPTCSSNFCSNCKQPWHGGTSCEEQARLAGNEASMGIPFDSDLIKCCPMCNVPIEKDEGCAQMMCKRCKHVFCWYCLASLDDDFLLRHYDKGPCKNKLGHSRASVIWHRTQVIGIFAGFGILLLVASPLLLLAAPCIVCCKCRVCNSNSKLDNDEDIPEESNS